MAGLNLRSIRVMIEFRRQPTKLSEGRIMNPVPATRPGNSGGWRPGHGIPQPIQAGSPEDTYYIQSATVYTNPVIDPIPARSY